MKTLYNKLVQLSFEMIFTFLFWKKMQSVNYLEVFLDKKEASMIT